MIWATVSSWSWRRSILSIHWNEWCWSWNSNTLATWCKELTHFRRLCCWERLKAVGDGDDRGWDYWMASPTQSTWVWASSKSWWWTGKPGLLQSVMGWQRVRHNWATELNWIPEKSMFNAMAWPITKPHSHSNQCCKSKCSTIHRTKKSNQIFVGIFAFISHRHFTSIGLLMIITEDQIERWYFHRPILYIYIPIHTCTLIYTYTYICVLNWFSHVWLFCNLWTIFP